MRNRSCLTSLITVVFLLLYSKINFAQNVQSSEKPNVIIILADDLGYGDLSCYGSQLVKTPNIDALAAQGIRFTNYHTAASICSPSRAALLTGAYPQRAGLYMGINPNREAHWFLGLNPSEVTIAEQFKNRDYTTFMVGKWHLGTEEMFSCLNQGFDDYYGMPCNFNHSKQFFDGKKLVYEVTPLEELTGLYTKRIVEFIKENSGKPFFLFYSHNYPHTPYKAGRKFIGSSEDGMRGDVIQEFDWSVGEIVKCLKESNILDNTIIIFTSDNGPVKEKYSAPYRGKKLVSLEGGHRVPFLISWPDGLKKPKTSDIAVNTMDIFPTLSEIIGAKLPDDRKYDGNSFLSVIDNSVRTVVRDKPFYYYNCENLQAVSYKNWKLHLPRTEDQIPWWDRDRQYVGMAKPVLYNLKEDLKESEDVSQKNPKIVRQLLEMAKVAREELGEYKQRGSGQRSTGTLFPEVPVISHPKDWEVLPESVKEITYKKSHLK